MDFSKIKENIKNRLCFLDDNNLLIILIVATSFLIRIMFLLHPPLRGWDETVYLNMGRQLSNNPLFYSLTKSGWNDYIPSKDIIYGWPNVGFRAPLLPYFLSFFYFIKLNFFVEIMNPLLGALSIFLIYILSKRMFNQNIGLFSAVLLALMPIHVFYSGLVLTDAFVMFFVLLTFFSFWQGYEKNDKKYKVLFGLFLALSLLARYTTLWVTPIFLLYFIVRDKSFKFLKDKYLWYSIGVFFVVLVPWFIYGYKYYGNILGAFIHGFKAASYWGGTQPWYFFFKDSWQITSIVGIMFIVSLFYIFIKKEFIKKEVYLLLIWFFFFLGMAMFMPHKEDRFIMPIIPVICIVSALFIDKLKKYKYLVFGSVCIVMLVFLIFSFKNGKEIALNNANACFSNGNQFLASVSMGKDALIITNQSPIVYYYTQKNNHLYPDPWSIDSLRNIIDTNYLNREVYIFFSNYDMSMNSPIKNDLDKNFEKAFECSKGSGYSAIYRYK